MRIERRDDPAGLRERLLRLLSGPGYIPLSGEAIARQLGLPAEEQVRLRDLLDLMESGRDIVRLRPDRYALREAIIVPGPAIETPVTEGRAAEPSRRREEHPDADTEIAKRYGLRIGFPDAVCDEAEEMLPVDSDVVTERADRRDTFVFTIDPDDARDFDDAISVEKTADGWRLAVHIADVSHYVKPGSALDREALRRGNSVYLASRVLPMLPERLSNELCSLRPGEDRFTVCAAVCFDASGIQKSVSFERAVIRSRHRLTYKQAFEHLKHGTGKGEIAAHLRVAADLAMTLRAQRMAAGALDLDFPEVKVRLDRDGNPVTVELIEHDISHQLIEEFMLAANEAVAREIRNKLAPSIYRVHEQPDPEKLAEFREVAALHGIRCGDLQNRRELTRTLGAIRRHPSARILQYALLRSLKKAAYDPRPLGHYGLSKSNYTHFTSPIRRYADLVVHRTLEQIGAIPKTRHHEHGRKPRTMDFAFVSEHISETERVAAEAERESTHLMKLRFLQQQISAMRPEVFSGIVVEVLRIGVLVEIPEMLLTGLVHVASLEGDFYRYDPGRRQLSGIRSRRAYRVGDKMDVIVARIDFARQQVDFHPAK